MTRRRWIVAIVAVVMAVCVVRFGLTFPWNQTVEALVKSDGRLLVAASLANIASIAAKAAAWYLLFQRPRPVRFRSAQSATFIGAAVGSISISVGGEVSRAQYVCTRDGVSFGTVAASLLVSRVVEAIGLTVFLSVALLALPASTATRLASAALGFGALLLLLGHRFAPWGRLAERARGRRYEPLVRLLASVSGGSLAAAVVLTVVNWVTQWATYHWSIAATRTVVGPTASLSALIVANVAGVLHLTPGNVGVMQGALVLGMRAFDVPVARSLAAGLALQAVEVLPILLIGVAIAGRHGVRRWASVAVPTSSAT